MADRTISAPALAELMSSSNQPVYLVAVYFDDGTIYLCDAWKPISWNGNTYPAQGYFLGFTGLEETAALTIPQLKITLSAVDQVWIAVALSKPYLDRRITISKAFLSYVDAVVSDPIMIFDGRLDGMDIADNPAEGTCTLQVTASSQFADFERIPGRHTNNAEQQRVFPADKGLEYASQLNKPIKWGAA